MKFLATTVYLKDIGRIIAKELGIVNRTDSFRLIVKCKDLHSANDITRCLEKDLFNLKHTTYTRNEEEIKQFENPHVMFIITDYYGISGKYVTDARLKKIGVI